ncbi:MAG TPA: GntR family transcriptional regulator, partial [Propionibacteriaceae bacterium]|nr:GntR family transcriptional regulator [Propionibacteriaceae bacterium]
MGSTVFVPSEGTIDRDSPVPYYFQLAELLEHEIVEGRWKSGDRLQSEPELCTRFGVSRTTVRQALARLEQQGLIRRHKGQGT